MTIHRFGRLPDGASITEKEAQIICAACPEDGLIIETGTYKGLGAERIAKHLPKGARLITLEAFQDLADEARKRLPPTVQVICVDSTKYVHRGRACHVLVLDCFPRREAWRNLKHCLAPGATVFVHDMDKPGPRLEFSDVDIELLGTENALGRVA